MEQSTLPKPKIPGATYRLQFNQAFTFRDATRIIAYLHDLGITDIYASPYFKAKQGSLHGYDIVDHTSLNPEIGTEEEYRSLIGELKKHDMGQVLDIVPNHMCIESSKNHWWQDVLENGPSSRYAAYFDIDWSPVKKELRNKVLIPVLGGQYGNVLENQDLRIVFDQGAFEVRYYDHAFPLRPQTYALLLEHRMQDLRAAFPEMDPDMAEYLSIITALKNLPAYTETDPGRIEERHREKEVIKRRLAALVDRSSGISAHVEENVRLFNGAKGEPRSFDLLDDLLNRQVYRLAFWRVATEEINYRRFFDVNGLGAIRMEHAEVFAAAHARILLLVREGSVTGLRVDHPDGLYNPVEYFHRLQRACFVQLASGPSGAALRPEDELRLTEAYDRAFLADPGYRPFYIVGEKILTKSERMPEDWPIFSTTGYVFLNSVNGVFIEGANAKAFDRIYEKFTGAKLNLPDVAYADKKLVMQVAMASEVNTLAHYLNDLSEKDRHTRDFTLNSLTDALVEVIALFPVYRTYTNSWSVAERDRQVVELAVSRAKRRNPAISASVFDFVRDVLLLRFPGDFRDEDKGAWLDFVMRFQQITGPVTAKGVEDTAFYVYNRLVSLNEVGGMPERFGTPLETFHGQNIERAKSWPHAMISTATHDTKRSEDVRARINVLSEIPEEWADRARLWARMNRKRKTVLDGREAPDRNDEYLLYQTLVGAWPVAQPEGRALEEFVGRIRDYMLKAAREAKANSSWISPDESYEQALVRFIEAVLRPSPKNVFLKDFTAFQRTISHYGMFNSLSQTLLKICSPGVPDIYQGTELWDFSLVDPDNRRPVDCDARMTALDKMLRRREQTTGTEMGWELTQNKDNGLIKMYLMHKALRCRNGHGELFARGEYLPLAPSGTHADHVCAFARTLAEDSVIAVVPRHLTKLIGGPGALPFGRAVWADTGLHVPEALARIRWQNVVTGEVVDSRREDGKTMLLLADVIASFPVALLQPAT